MSKVALFGCNGYIGRHVLRESHFKGIVCDGFDIHDNNIAECETYSRCDVIDEEFWLRFNPEEYSSIIFLSGLSGVESSFIQAKNFVAVNIMGFLNLLERIKDLGENAPRIIFTSSRLVYEGGSVVEENSLRRARSIYAATKTACEELLSAYHARYGLKYVVFRICVPYGNLVSKDYSYGTIGFFMSQLFANNSIKIWGDGTNKKTYTHISDICRIIMHCCEGEIPTGIYNIGGYDYTLEEVAQMITAKFGGMYEKIPWPVEAARVEMGDISLNSGKLAKIINIGYKHLEDYIDDL